MNPNMSHYEEFDSLDPRNTESIARIEAPTPHKISVLLLVQIYLKVKKTTASAGIIYSAKSRREFCMLLLKLIQYPDMTYKELYTLLTTSRYIVETHHLETFAKSIAELFSSGVDALLDFAELQNIERMLSEEMCVSQFSVVGLYIRRIGVIIERMSFAEMLALYNNMHWYYKQGLCAIEASNRDVLNDGTPPRAETPVESFISCTDSFLHNEGEMIKKLEESSLDTEVVYLNRDPHCKWSPRQADLFVIQQCDFLEHNDVRALPPIELQKKINDIIKDNPLNTAAYFLQYMNQVRLHDFFGGKDAMHRAFDRCPSYMMNQCEQKGFQYFCVNLAVLHSHFDHFQEGLCALKESVMIAQDKGDERCLRLAKSWYCLLNGIQTEPLEKYLTKMLMPDQAQTLSLSLQFVVKHGILCGYRPRDVFELLIKSEDINGKCTLLEYLPDLLAMHSALWCFYGLYDMSAVNAQLLLNLRKTWAFGDVGNSESIANMLANFVLCVDKQGEHHFSTILLQHAKIRFTRFPNAVTWVLAECLVNIQERVHQKLWHDAQRVCCNLYIFDKSMANLHCAVIFLAKRHLSIARQSLIDLLALENLDMLTQVRALILLAQITISSGNIYMTKAIPLLVQASTIAYLTSMEYELGLIDMTLAHILLSMNMAEKAFQAVVNSMERLYTTGGIYERSKMDLIFIRTYVGAPRDDDIEQRLRLYKCIPSLERSIEIFHKLKAHEKVLDVMIYITEVFHGLKQRDERNRYAARFKQYYLEYPTPVEYLGVIF